MILSNRDIQRALVSGDLEISPPPSHKSYATSSVDFHAGHQFMRWKPLTAGARLTVDLSVAKIADLKDYVEQVQPERDGLITVPTDDFLLCLTLEVLGLPPKSKLAGRVEGRSTLARYGLSVHITAPTIHCGFFGPICLEMRNHGPHILRIKPGHTPLCQVIFERVSSQPTVQLATMFQHQEHVLGKRHERPLP